MADHLRNEVEVEFGGKKHTMRADIDAIRAIESDLKRGVIRLIRDFGQADYGINEMVSVLFHGLKSAGGTMSVEEVAQQIMLDGIDNASAAAMTFLHQSMGGVSMGKPQAEKTAA